MSSILDHPEFEEFIEFLDEESEVWWMDSFLEYAIAIWKKKHNQKQEFEKEKV